MSQHLPFFLSDTLGMTLYQIDGKFKGTEIRTVKLGPWKLDLPITVESDIISHKEVSSWVTIGTGPGVDLYLVVRDKETLLFVLNKGCVKSCYAKTGFEATTVEKRLEEMKLAIRDIFQWEDGTWTQMEMVEVA